MRQGIAQNSVIISKDETRNRTNSYYIKRWDKESHKQFVYFILSGSKKVVFRSGANSQWFFRCSSTRRTSILLIVILGCVHPPKTKCPRTKIPKINQLPLDFIISVFLNIILKQVAQSKIPQHCFYGGPYTHPNASQFFEHRSYHSRECLEGYTGSEFLAKCNDGTWDVSSWGRTK